MPDVLVTQLLLLYRYIFVLGGETMRMARARALRSFGSAGMGLGVYAQILGHLLLRTYARAQRITRRCLRALSTARCGCMGTLHFTLRDTFRSRLVSGHLRAVSCSSTSRSHSGIRHGGDLMSHHSIHMSPMCTTTIRTGRRRSKGVSFSVGHGESIALVGERRGQVDAADASHGVPVPAEGDGAGGRRPGHEVHPARHTAHGRDGVPGPRRPTLHAERQGGRRVRAAEPRMPAEEVTARSTTRLSPRRGIASQGPSAVPALGRREAGGLDRDRARDVSERAGDGRAVLEPRSARPAQAHRPACDVRSHEDHRHSRPRPGARTVRAHDRHERGTVTADGPTPMSSQTTASLECSGLERPLGMQGCPVCSGLGQRPGLDALDAGLAPVPFPMASVEECSFARPRRAGPSPAPRVRCRQTPRRGRRGGGPARATAAPSRASRRPGRS
jgi:hypothetical protein